MKKRLPAGEDQAASKFGTGHEFEVFFDGACPMCSREIAMLRRLDRKKRIRFSDIALADFDAAELGKSQASMMAEIHGRLPDGSWVVGVEVFRRLYAAIGLRGLVAISRLPGISHGLELGYRIFAPLRLRLRPQCSATGNCRTSKTGRTGRNEQKTRSHLQNPPLTTGVRP